MNIDGAVATGLVAFGLCFFVGMETAKDPAPPGAASPGQSAFVQEPPLDLGTAAPLPDADQLTRPARPAKPAERAKPKPKPKAKTVETKRRPSTRPAIRRTVTAQPAPPASTPAPTRRVIVPARPAPVATPAPARPRPKPKPKPTATPAPFDDQGQPDGGDFDYDEGS